MKLSIRQQLLGAFGVTLAVLLGVSLFQIQKIRSGNEKAGVLQANVAKQDLTGTIATNFALGRLAIYRALASAPAQYEGLGRELDSLSRATQANIDSLAKITTGETAVSVKELAPAWKTYADARGEGMRLIRAGRPDEAKKVITGAAAAAFAIVNEKNAKVTLAITKDAADTYAAVQAEATRVLWTVTIVIALVVVGVIVLALWTAGKITRPLNETVNVLQHVADGDLTPRLVVRSEDEIGQMGVALNTALESVSTAMAAIGQNAQALASSSEELSAVSTQMGGNATETSSQASVVSAAAEQVSRNVQTVATGTEEMSASIREIAKHATDAAKVANAAVTVAESTNASIGKLGESSVEIGNVIKVITSIAQQTNLLALNATIEAARAGEAGKGFAVVANEVKELAKETAKATEDISQKIEVIQGDTKSAIEAITQITTIIAQINDAQTTIAGAVEEQTATTNEMARNVEEAAKGSAEIAQNITGVAQAAESTSSGAGNSQVAANELARMAAELHEIVSRFKFDQQVKATAQADVVDLRSRKASAGAAPAARRAA
ncbi:MAG: methyl-accepting chemotaxis protein [Gemmatimonadaceae bacterium]|nr:methyl-accepting chemotaxis protein [Gemmatimonadaceae bacterium]